SNPRAADVHLPRRDWTAGSSSAEPGRALSRNLLITIIAFPGSSIAGVNLGRYSKQATIALPYKEDRHVAHVAIHRATTGFRGSRRCDRGGSDRRRRPGAADTG